VIKMVTNQVATAWLGLTPLAQMSTYAHAHNHFTVNSIFEEDKEPY